MKHSIILLIAILFFQKSFTQDWIPLHGPLAYSPSAFIVTNKTDELFVLSSSGEVFASRDKGFNWRNVTDGIIYVREFQPSKKKFHETVTGKLFLLYAKHFYEYDYTNSKWIIRNDSVSLTDYTTGPNGIIYAGNEKSFYMSDNDGTSFTRKSGWLAPKLRFECQGNGNNFVRLDTKTPLITFDDAGNVFDSIKMPDGRCGEILYDSVSGNLMNFNSLGLYKTKDKGNKWQRIDSIRMPIGTDNTIFRMPNGKIFNISSPIRFSEDGGDTWKHDTVYGTIMNSYNYTFHGILNDYTLFYYYDNFTILEPGKSPYGIVLPLQNPLVNNLLTYGENGIICNTDWNEFIHLSKDNGLTWKLVDLPYVSSWFFKDELLDASGSLYYLESDSIVIFNFETEELKVRNYPFDWLDYHGGFVSKTNKAFLFNGESVFVTSNQASTWSRHPVKKDLKFHFHQVQCSVNDILYYYNEDSIFYSFDFGSNWSYFLTNNEVLEIYRLSKNNVFYWLEDGVPDYKRLSSSDFGKTQTELPQISGAFMYHINDNDILYYISNNPNEIITIVHNGMIEHISDSGLDLKLNEPKYHHISRNGYIYLYRPHNLPFRTIKKLTATESVYQMTTELHTVPNPFRDETVLKLPKEFDSQVKHCTVYDVSGNKVLEFTSREQNLKLSSDVLVNGFYIVHVTTDKNIRAVGKILINK